MVTFSDMSIEYLWIIDAGYAYGAVVVREHKVSEAAPIFRKILLGHSTRTAKWIIRKRGWKLIKIVRRRI